LLDAQPPDVGYVRQQTDGVSEIILCCEMPATGGFNAQMQHATLFIFSLMTLPNRGRISR
jgi:hypothetical protein